MPYPVRREPRVDPSDLRAVYDAHCDFVWRRRHRLGIDERDLADLTHVETVRLAGARMLRAIESRANGAGRSVEVGVVICGRGW